MESKMLFGGVEGGATHSNLVVLDEDGRVVASSKGPGTNHWAITIPECADRIIAMVNTVKDEMGIPRDRPLDGLGLTLSGCEQESSNAELVSCVRDKDPTCAKEMYAASDTVGSLYTGAPDGGMVVIAGTGSNALLRTAGGEQYGCGGWGHLLGDEGGAYWIAHRAVKAIFDDIDGLRQCAFPTDRVWDLIREHFNVDTRMDLLPHAYKDFQKSHFAGLTAELAYLAGHGDRLAQQMFIDAGAALADHVVALLRHTHGHGDGVGRMRVVCVGSVWKSWSLLQPGVLKRFAEKMVKTELELVRLRVPSAMGAAWQAARNINHNMPRDDSAFCEVFYTYQPVLTNGKRINGTYKLESTRSNDNGSTGYDNGTASYDNGSAGYDNGTASYDNGSAGLENKFTGYENGTNSFDSSLSFGNGTPIFENGRNGDH